MEEVRKSYLMFCIRIVRDKGILIPISSLVYSMNIVAKNEGFEGNFTIEEINKYLSLI
jgi:hypothetical protein